MNNVDIKLDKETIKQIALANGFKLKEQADGRMDLNPYVYEFTNAIAEHCWSAFKSGVMPHKIHPTKASLNNGWISVDDMLPIDEGFVLLLKDDDDIIIGQYVFDTSPYFATSEFYQNQDYDWVADLDDITHWKHLPQLPKE